MVEGYRLKGISQDSEDGYTGGELVGSMLVIEQEGNADLFEVKIEQAGQVPFVDGGNLIDGSTADPVITYKLAMRVLPNGDPRTQRPFTPVCGANSIELLDRFALVFAGNRYSSDGSVLATGPETHPWFNLACKDTAMWKSALFRLVDAGKAGELFPSDAVDHEASMRSIVADYCGTGDSHTELGTDVEWGNRGGWLTNNLGYPALEAVWNQDGAICIGKPRLPETDPDNLGCDHAVRRCTLLDRVLWRKFPGNLIATWVP